MNFLCDDLRCGNSNLFENYNLNPNEFSDVKEGEIREVFINLEDWSSIKRIFIYKTMYN